MYPPLIIGLAAIVSTLAIELDKPIGSILPIMSALPIKSDSPITSALPPVELLSMKFFQKMSYPISQNLLPEAV